VVLAPDVAIQLLTSVEAFPVVFCGWLAVSTVDTELQLLFSVVSFPVVFRGWPAVSTADTELQLSFLLVSPLVMVSTLPVAGTADVPFQAALFAVRFLPTKAMLLMLCVAFPSELIEVHSMAPVPFFSPTLSLSSPSLVEFESPELVVFTALPAAFVELFAAW